MSMKRISSTDVVQQPLCVPQLLCTDSMGQVAGGPLIVELSDVVLCVAARQESDWEEGPALRRARAAKQAQLAAAELTKLGNRVAATGSHQQQQQPAPGPADAGAAGSSNSWSWVINGIT